MPHRPPNVEYLLRGWLIPARNSVRGPDGFWIGIMAGGTLVGWLIVLLVEWLRR